MFSGLHEQDYSLHGLDPNFGSFMATYDSPVASVRRTTDAAAVARNESLELTYSSYITGCMCVEIQKFHTGTTNNKYTYFTTVGLVLLCNAVKKIIYVYIYIYIYIYIYGDFNY